MYLVFALMAGVIGGLLSIAIRMELHEPRHPVLPRRRTNTTCSSPRTA